MAAGCMEGAFDEFRYHPPALWHRFPTPLRIELGPNEGIAGSLVQAGGFFSGCGSIGMTAP